MTDANTQGNQDEENWDLGLRYRVRILIKHPNMDPAAITETLSIKPNMTQKLGEIRRAPNGILIGGTYRRSAWSHWFSVEHKRLFYADVVAFIDRLESNREFLHSIVQTGGTITIDVALPGDRNIGDVISWQNLLRLADLQVSLGVEVFPDG